jgi:hypothetical protein
MVPESEEKGKVSEYLRSIDCAELPVVLIPNNIRKSYKLSATPMTLIVTGDGNVGRVWYGQWNQDAVAAASSFFGVPFPRS